MRNNIDLTMEPALRALLEASVTPAETPTYFPGRDYPDREVWLAKRNNTVAGKLVPARWLYRGEKPLILGINNAKRRALAIGEFANPKHNSSRALIVKHRHEAIRKMAA